MAYDIRKIKDTTDLIGYFSENLGWNIDMDYVDDIEDIAYDFTAADIGLKEDAFARISALRQMQPLVDGQKWGVFCVEFDSQRFEAGALRKILSKLIPRRRNSADHAVWDQQDLLFICNWGKDNNRTIGLAHFEDQGKDLPQIRMISCAPAVEDFTQIKIFEDRLSLLRWPKDTSNIEEWRRTWASAFTTGYREVIHTSALLTTRLAAEAQNIRNHILEILEVETENGYVHKLFDKFRETLIHDMTETQFADMYAQTVVYGLFSARCMDVTQDNFSAAEAVNCIPNTNPFLKNLMRECLGANSSRLSFDEMEIGNVVELLRNTHTDAIIQDFNRQTGGGREDPVIHFYEEFLTAYDKAQKVQRGVYYTPQPVVNFIVRAVDDILKTEFGLPEGLASTATKQVKTQRLSERKINGMYRMIDTMATVPAVQVLDPATGTGTFLRQVILQIYENFKLQHRGKSKEAIRAAWNEYVPKHLLPRLNGFELMMAPYAVAHMKLAMVLKDTGYDFGSEGRLNVCLTNTLEEPGNSDDQISMFDDPLATESVEANKVKKNNGVNIILGNPPYSGGSMNKGEWILSLIEPYRREPGGQMRLKEIKTHIDNDYVKFIRYAHHLLEKDQPGVLAYITPRDFIFSPTFRGMRWQLMKGFDAVYIIDLNGDARQNRNSQLNDNDENVFDIQQGVCISIWVKRKSSAQMAKVYIKSLRGERVAKFQKIDSFSTLCQFGFSEIIPEAPFYLFNQLGKSTLANTKYVALNELFISSVNGIQTGRDTLTIQDSRDTIMKTINRFIELDAESARIEFGVGKDGRDWRVEWAQQDVRSSLNGTGVATPILYRPFDVKWTYYTGPSGKGFLQCPRGKLMQNLVGNSNLGLIVGRQGQAVGNIEWCLAYITKGMPTDLNIFYRGGGMVFPLYIDCHLGSGIVANINSNIAKEIASAIGLEYSGDAESAKANTLLPEHILMYVYAVLYSHKYRSEHVQELSIDFPKIPLPTNRKNFDLLVDYGRQLVEMHTIEDNEGDSALQQDATIGKYCWKNGKVYINNTFSFDCENEAVWNYYIGGYQPLQKWLKDRKEKTLTHAEVTHYKYMIARITRTMDIMQAIDEVIEL